ncbi:Cd(II)/Pb(II)-responsive transcriptional regulator [Acinetobacter stercoris]|uniref:HTH-type transcriptional regulator CueR n=1 Tax=Acinetobacter stercoris TaxID=2126983 RepID=A0A2U3N2E9_9GAMM|nr:Cd(II)/Pb(II)-responsive transcriptional regulator [Acinetobacter stercoris]SPL71848.1 HTH-type transcriptional regulator CueR [Acinetobacter stercoris]
MKNYLIHELAKQTQLSVDSIRFYEKKNLIEPSFRAVNNYRYYDQEALKRLVFIKRCRALDMSLDEISQLMELIRHPEQGCQVVDQLVEQHILKVNEKIRELQKFQSELQQLRQLCQNDTTIDHCQIIKHLAD